MREMTVSEAVENWDNLLANVKNNPTKILGDDGKAVVLISPDHYQKLTAKPSAPSSP